jgi:hypothetical protein
MDCALSMLIACLSWSGLYIDSGVSFQDRGEYREQWKSFELRSDGLIESGSYLAKSDSAQNPYGRIALGYEVGFTRLTWRLEASHVSSMVTNRDRGVNAVSVSARWYPFRSR